MKSKCECADPGCLAHFGSSSCPKICLVASLVYDFENLSYFGTRIDQRDDSGTLFCPACAEDAAKTGLFTFEKYR